MADERNNRHGRDRDRLASNEQQDVGYLAEKFGVEKQIVMDAIRVCGGDRQQIEEYLKERTGRGRGDLNISETDDGRNSPS